MSKEHCVYQVGCNLCFGKVEEDGRSKKIPKVCSIGFESKFSKGSCKLLSMGSTYVLGTVGSITTNQLYYILTYLSIRIPTIIG